MNNLYTISIPKGTPNNKKRLARPLLLLALLLFGATGAWAQTYINLSNVNSDITVGNGCWLTGTLGNPNKISIADGATVTLSDVTIDPSWWGQVYNTEYAGITCLGNATLTLVGTNNIMGFHNNYPGIYVPVGHTLTIQGVIGSLTARSMLYGAGIGGGNGISCGNIVIAGGNITALGGNKAAGIGAGENASCGTISITGGTVNAKGGKYATGIGSGEKSSCGAITISGGTVIATGGDDGSGIGSGFNNSSCTAINISGGAITATGSDGGAGIGSGEDSSCGPISISGGFVKAFGVGGGAGIGSGEESSCTSIYITGGIVNAKGGTQAAGIGSGDEASCGPVTITDGVTQVTATKGSNYDNIHSIGKGDDGTCGTVTIGGTVYWENNQYQNGGDDPQTGIVKSPYYYPIPSHTLGAIPSDWTVTADGQTVTVTPYYDNAPLGYASIPQNVEVVLTPPDPDRVISVSLIDPLTIPLTFEAKEAGAQVTFTIKADAAPNDVKYSTDGTSWNTYSSGTAITLEHAGDKVSFCGTNATYATGTGVGGGSTFSCTADCYIYGNVMSLINKDNFATNTELAITEQFSLCRLFANNTHIWSHDTKPLLLPATTLNNYCYAMMFAGCTNLTTAPELPATILKNNCYHMMFRDCQNLTTAPELPAKALQSACYCGMFLNCPSLTTPPDLPATTLAANCYECMFQGDISLTMAPELPATTLAPSCYKYMFFGCKNLTSAPVLPATTLTGSCYSLMFYGCTNLNKVTCLATDISAGNCTSNWLGNVAPTGTFIKPASVTWPTNDVSGIPPGWTTIPYETFLPLTFEAKTAGATVTFTKATTLTLNDLEYNVYDGNGWQNYTSGDAITLANIGDKVSFRGNNASYAKDRIDCSTFSCSADCYIYGNVMSLIDKDNFATNTTLDVNASYSFCKLFFLNTHIFNHDSKPLLLPATTLNAMCYFYMFYGCSNLTQAPALPATTLANGCYMWMFDGCHLTEAPELHATTLTESCYYGMFSGCTVLDTVPALPATTLANDCYHSMFSGCTSLTTAPVLPATTLANYCYANMFQNCTSLTPAPELPATTLANSCYANMFRNCTSLTTAPELPAPTLESNCYYCMFLGCTDLNSVTCLATSGINSNNSTTNWLYNVAATGTFVKPETMNDWTTNSPNGIPQGWTINGKLPGQFTVNASGGKVNFSQGNLQATTSDLGENWTWAFATNQWDYVGNAAANNSINGNGTVSTNGTVDLFGWVGASSTWTGAAQYGISNSTTTNSTSTYGNNDSEALKSDWGNTIGSGWRTLTKDEWTYVFNTRTVNGGTGSGYSYTKGQSVNSTLGLVIYPDDYTGSEYAGSDWATFEAAGCVFLPAAGLREGSEVVNYGVVGRYWTSTLSDEDSAFLMYFLSSSGPDKCPGLRCHGLSVRLVKNAN